MGAYGSAVDGTTRDVRRAALALLARGRGADAVQAALETLPDGDPEVREAILARYNLIAAAPRRLDADCAIRAALLRGLRSCVISADGAMLERAAQTYEHGYAGEAASNLRAAALLTLSEIDNHAAAFHAVRLLGDAAAGSREPALTAARLLAMLGEPLPLYAHLVRGRVEGVEAAECFRGLAGAPDSILFDLAERWSDSDDEVALLGLLDTLLDALADRTPPSPFDTLLLRFLRYSPQLDLVRYLATAIVARHREALIEALREGPWPEPDRREIVGEALGLLSDGH
jgi:hypothetical protein